MCFSGYIICLNSWISNFGLFDWLIQTFGFFLFCFVWYNHNKLADTYTYTHTQIKTVALECLTNLKFVCMFFFLFCFVFPVFFRLFVCLQFTYIHLSHDIFFDICNQSMFCVCVYWIDSLYIGSIKSKKTLTLTSGSIARKKN